MSDPASVEVSVAVAGLAPTEAAVVYRSVPAGCRFVVEVSQPAIGPLRHAVTVRGLSILGAKMLCSELFEYLDNPPLADWERELLEGGQAPDG